MERKSKNAKTLTQIQAAFFNLRQQWEGKRTWYPSELKTLALDALAQGCSQAEVAQAAGVHLNSITNWTKIRKTRTLKKETAPVELKLVDWRAPGSASAPTPAPLRTLIRSAPSGHAKILLRSGISIELPASCLSENLLSILMRGTP